MTSQENDFLYLHFCLDVDHVVVGSLQEYLVQTSGMKSFLVFLVFKNQLLYSGRLLAAHKLICRRGSSYPGRFTIAISLSSETAESINTRRTNISLIYLKWVEKMCISAVAAVSITAL